MMRRILGIDAGGTGSRAMLIDQSTGELRQASGPAANWTRQGPEHCQRTAQSLILQLLPDGEAPDAVALCVAGFYPPDHQRQADEWLAAVLPDSRAVVLPDVQAAWAGAHGCGPGIVLVAGTGSICYGRNEQGQEARAGGWGPTFGDLGSAYSMGAECLRSLANHVDGIGPATSLSSRLLRRWPELGQDLTSWLRGIYREQWDTGRIAGLAREVVAAAEEGDTLANSLVLRASAELLTLAGAVSRRLGGEAQPLALMGGLGLTRALREAFSELAGLSRAGIHLVEPQYDPLRGAVLLAAHHADPSAPIEQIRSLLQLDHPVANAA